MMRASQRFDDTRRHRAIRCSVGKGTQLELLTMAGMTDNQSQHAIDDRQRKGTRNQRCVGDHTTCNCPQSVDATKYYMGAKSILLH
jgi:hypothetical protein